MSAATVFLWIILGAFGLYVLGVGLLLAFGFLLDRRESRRAAQSFDYAKMAREAEAEGMPSSAALWWMMHDLSGPGRTPEPPPAPEFTPEPELAPEPPPTRSGVPRREEFDREDAARERMKRSLRPATREEYQRFLTTWAKCGGRVMHCDYPFERCQVWVATADLHAEPLHGASGLGLILVPGGITVTGREPGHTDIVWLNSNRSLGFHGQSVYQVPAFSDVPVHAAR